MDLKLIEKFLQAMMPAEGKPAVNTAFECMRAHPMSAVPSIGMMVGRLQQRLYSSDENEQVAGASNVLVGVMIAWASEDPALRKYIIEDYLEQDQRKRGENVIDFWQGRAGR